MRLVSATMLLVLPVASAWMVTAPLSCRAGASGQPANGCARLLAVHHQGDRRRWRWRQYAQPYGAGGAGRGAFDVPRVRRVQHGHAGALLLPRRHHHHARAAIDASAEIEALVR